jgi:hypothetical protein
MQLILNHYQFDYYLSRKKYMVGEFLFFKILLTDLVGPNQNFDYLVNNYILKTYNNNYIF